MSDGASLTCSLSGYQVMVDDIIALSLLAITLNASIIEAIISGLPDLQQAFKLTIRFLRSSGSWVGYLIGAVYFFGLEFGYGEYLCTASQYGFYVIYYLNLAITFGQGS